MESGTTQRSTTEFAELFVHDQYSWCRLLWQDDGRVIILSDYGNWSFWWGHRGSNTVPEFLASLDSHYMGKKMLGTDLLEFSATRTVQHIREHIIDYRYRHRELSKDQARDEWNLSKELLDGDIGFGLWCDQTTIPDSFEFYGQEMCSEWVHFWNRLWVPLICPALQAECAEVASAG